MYIQSLETNGLGLSHIFKQALWSRCQSLRYLGIYTELGINYSHGGTLYFLGVIVQRMCGLAPLNTYSRNEENFPDCSMEIYPFKKTSIISLKKLYVLYTLYFMYTISCRRIFKN